MARKVVVVTPAKVKRVMIAGECSCGQRLLKGMIRCPGCGTIVRQKGPTPGQPPECRYSNALWQLAQVAP
ncbi:MAG: hypothetical protein NT137_08535 [Methanomassiliicoccales archaeon]|nr:hypothetical protein [Methanomassiliicoccales archaeon]